MYIIISDRSKDDIYLVDRTLQALEAIDWIHTTSSGSSLTSRVSYDVGTKADICDALLAPDLIILAGDLNTEPGFFPYRVLTELGSLIDANGNKCSFIISLNLQYILYILNNVKEC